MVKSLIVGEGDIFAIAEVEVVGNDGLSDPLENPFAFGLVDGFVEEPVFEGDKFDVSDFVNAIFHESANRLAICDDAEVGFLKNDDDADDKVELFVEFGRDGFRLFLKDFLVEGLDFGCLPVYFEEVLPVEDRRVRFELHRWTHT